MVVITTKDSLFWKTETKNSPFGLKAKKWLNLQPKIRLFNMEIIRKIVKRLRKANKWFVFKPKIRF